MLVAMLILMAAGPSGAPVECDAQTVAHYVAELTAAQRGLAGNGGRQQAARQFFRAMPTSFGCFNEVFGYPRDQPGPLYSEPQLHELFPRLAAAVPLREFAHKLVGLAVNARWEADQTGALQHAVRAVLDGTPAVVVGELKQLSPTDEYSVWQFLFGAPHPSNEPLSPDLEKRVCSFSTRSCKLSALAYARAIGRERAEH